MLSTTVFHLEEDKGQILAIFSTQKHVELQKLTYLIAIFSIKKLIFDEIKKDKQKGLVQ